MPLVSVIMTTYNNERHIASAISSVVNQGWGDFELIVVEDAGKDATYDIASGFVDKRISVFRNERNLGQHRNKNAGLAKARGKLIKFVDGDDVLEPGGLEKLVNVYDAYGGRAAAVFGRTRYIDDTGNAVGASPPWGLRGVVNGIHLLEHIALKVGFGGCPFGNPTGHLFTRTVLDEVGGFPDTNTYAGDCETFFKVLSVSDAAFMDDVVASYRRQPASLSATTSALSQLRDAFVSIRSLQEFMSCNDDLPASFQRQEFRRGIVAAFTKHLVATQALRRRLGRSNCFTQMAELFKEADYGREFRYLCSVETPRYFLSVAAERLRARLGLAPCSTFSMCEQSAEEPT